MKPSEFDTLIRSALLDAAREDLAGLLAEEWTEPVFSPRHLRRRARLLADPLRYGKHRGRGTWNRALRAAACILLAVGIALGGLLAVNRDARAWVVRMVTEWFETHTSYTFVGDGDETADVTQWRPGYLPGGFAERSVEEINGSCYITYTDDGDGVIYFTAVLAADGQRLMIDNEHATPRQVTVNGCAGTLYEADRLGEFHYLIWVDEEAGVGFALISNTDKTELLSVGESVEKTKYNSLKNPVRLYPPGALEK